MSTSVLIVDDHRTFAELLKIGLGAQPDLECAGVAHSVVEATRLADVIAYQAAIVDLGLPDGDGAELVAHLQARAPGARIVVLTAHPRSDRARRALAAGAHAVLPKGGRLDDVLHALRTRIPRQASAEYRDPLTPREREVLSLLADGADVRSIARTLELSPYTVRDHVKAILAKLDARTQLEAVVVAAREGIVLLDPR
ncbi:MAG: response regulator transcription factor [Propionicimonas sp.]